MARFEYCPRMYHRDPEYGNTTDRARSDLRRESRSDDHPASRTGFQPLVRPELRPVVRNDSRSDSRPDDSRDSRKAAPDDSGDPSGAMDEIQKTLASLPSQVARHNRQTRIAQESPAPPRRDRHAAIDDQDALEPHGALNCLLCP